MARAYHLGLIDKNALQRLRHYYSLEGQHLLPREALAGFRVSGPGWSLVSGDEKSLDRYRISDRLTRLDEEPIGSGGMGSIYRCHENVLNRVVALKLIKNASGNALPRFEREAKVMARLSHPNCVKVFEAGLSITGEPYYTMELIDGRSLEEMIPTTAGGLDIAQTVAWIRAIGEALQTCHDHGVIHRDVKPANILIDTRGVPLLTDFGVAHADETRSTLTHRGSLLGTLGYCPPEQLGGETIGPQADVYALGATLHHALSGQKLFDDEDGRRVLVMVLNAEPTPLRELRPEVPEQLERIVLRCLEKSPDDRFATAGELVEALDAVLSHVPEGWRFVSGKARTPSAELPTRRLRWPTVVVPLITLLLGGGLGLLGGIQLAGGEVDTATRPPTEQDPPSPPPSEGKTQDPAVPGAGETKSNDSDSDSPASAIRPVMSQYINHRDGSVLLLIPPGSFEMGDRAHNKSDEVPVHRVTFRRGFLLGKFEVTWKQYRAFCSASQRSVPSDVIALSSGPRFKARPDHPVFNVTWDDAQAYCQWAGLRLPTEAEWEYASKGKTHKRIYPWEGMLQGRPIWAGPVANMADMSAKRLRLPGLDYVNPDLRYYDGWPFTSPVGSFPLGVTPFGCLDMAGNVNEWVSDWYGAYRPGVVENPQGPASGSDRAFRGGSWRNSNWGCRTAQRFSGHPATRMTILGFRVALSLPED